MSENYKKAMEIVREKQKEKFFSQCSLKNGNNIDISEFDYRNNREKGKCKCKICGYEWMEVPEILRKREFCPKCLEKLRNKEKREKTLLKNKEKAEKLYKNSNISDINFFYNKKDELMVKFSCHEKYCNGEEHGEQIQTGYYFLKGGGCAKCATHPSKAYTNEEWIRLAKEKYPEFQYNKVQYINKETKVIIICQKHGEVLVNPKDFLSGRCYCPKCTIEKQHDKFVDRVIKRAQKVHKNNYYIYHPELIKNSTEKIGIECPKHGIFWQTISNHITKKAGCPICNESKLEKEIRNILIENNISFESQKRFIWLGKQSLDFYLSEYNIGIECQGEQHFESLEFFQGDEGLKKIQERDELKKKLCEENNINLIYYGSSVFKDKININDIYFSDKNKMISYIITQKILLF